ncbi:MAG: Tad domain-containing protein [Planctomycetaceae bacterium]
MNHQLQKLDDRLGKLFREIHGEEDGLLTAANAVFMMLCVLLMVYVLNVGHITTKKVDLQNAADASAYSGATYMARGMNAITATNHVIGEMNAMVILHYAFGGDKLDAGKRADVGTNVSEYAKNPGKLDRADWQLEVLFRLVQSENPPPAVFNLVLQRQGNSSSGASEIRAEATELDSKMNLKKHLAQAYQGLVVAMALKAFPPTRPAGEALSLVMKLYGFKIAQEYATLNVLHQAAKALTPVKQLLKEQLMPSAKAYTTFVKKQTPILAEQAARAVAKQNGFVGTTFPQPGNPRIPLRLPLQIDPLAIAKIAPLQGNSNVVEEPGPTCDCPPSVNYDAPTWDRVVKWTQLARASFPWVNYHRKPVMDAFGKLLQLAETKDLYFHWTNGYTKRICRKLQKKATSNERPNEHMALYVMDDYEGPDKGYEKWAIAEYSDLATKRFSVLAVTHAKPPTVIGSSVFGQEHPNGMMTWSMGLFYNANEQQRPNHRIDPYCQRTVPGRQANVGYDTLNWYPGSNQDTESRSAAMLEPPDPAGPGEYRPYEVQGRGIPHEYPRIQVNWQAKLVPVSGLRLKQIHDHPPSSPFGQVIRRTTRTVLDFMRTH